MYFSFSLRKRVQILESVTIFWNEWMTVFQFICFKMTHEYHTRIFRKKHRILSANSVLASRRSPRTATPTRGFRQTTRIIIHIHICHVTCSDPLINLFLLFSRFLVLLSSLCQSSSCDCHLHPFFCQDGVWHNWPLRDLDDQLAHNRFPLIKGVLLLHRWRCRQHFAWKLVRERRKYKFMSN